MRNKLALSLLLLAIVVVPELASASGGIASPLKTRCASRDSSSLHMAMLLSVMCSIRCKERPPQPGICNSILLTSLVPPLWHVPMEPTANPLPAFPV